jgi:hypothetical protein
MGWPAITEADVEETDREVAAGERSMVEAGKRLEEMKASGEQARLDARTEIELAEDYVKMYEGRPTILTQRKKKMKVVDRVILGALYGWADEIPDHITEAEIDHYLSLGEEEKKIWLTENQAEDVTEKLRNMAVERLEKLKEEKKTKVVRKADYVRSIEQEVAFGYDTKGATTGFIGFRTWYGDDSEWEDFKKKLEEAVKKGWKSEAEDGSDPDDMLSRFEIRWIEDKEKFGGKTVSEIKT